MSTNISTKIIEGSKNWVQSVPDEYAIRCIESYPSLGSEWDKIFKFLFVESAEKAYGSGFVQICGIAKVPFGANGIIILKDDFSPMPKIYFVYGNKLVNGGQLQKCEISWAANEQPKFSNIYHYCERNLERQKSDADAPVWLKDFTRERGGSVACFEF